MSRNAFFAIAAVLVLVTGAATGQAYHEQMPYTPIVWDSGVTPYDSFDGTVLMNGIFEYAGYDFKGTLYTGESGWFVVTGDGQVPMAGPGYGPLPNITARL